MQFIVLLEAVVWSVLWSIVVFTLILRFPWLIEHDYPKDIREAANIPRPSAPQKRNGLIFSILGYFIIIGTLMGAGLWHYHSTPISFWSLLLHLWIICFFWNIVDLLILDWLIVCAITPDWLMIPGTEHCKGWKDYKFHFNGFLQGCFYMSLIALVFTVIDYGILYFFLW
ncbi:small-conductance mechanosensitive channel [Aequitasia blattaphilus]|uniref:Uncharacterized protein n=1 Tax=Aequitasia blattaphilus TaxID=2949332 RepID=A0ABT1EBP0_9FIRM|nr:hypothetical protein [Aequitasia blattaphilus]MCP1103227.1 hypothetical protein [Aequitasia blattaphilus]MCR8615867.1 hypothetical protein [Aequitasia blattaphilus]